MATKKSSSAAKKKTAPKKQAVKKKSASAKNQRIADESAALYTDDASVQASLQAGTANSISDTEKSESGNGIYLFLVLAGVAAIGYLGYAKYSAKKPESTQTKATTPINPSTEQSKPESTTEKVVETQEKSDVPTTNFVLDKIESGKKWSEAESYCKKLNATLPSKQEFAKFKDGAPSELKNGDVYWTRNFPSGTDTKAYGYNIKSGEVVKILKSEKHKVVCKN